MARGDYEDQQRGLALGYLGNTGRERNDLTDQEIAVLVLADQPPHVAGYHERRVLMTFGWSLTTYSWVLNGLLSDERALAFHPTLINRLRRLRDARMAQRGH
jgi:hypothetical protein